HGWRGEVLITLTIELASGEQARLAAAAHGCWTSGPRPRNSVTAGREPPRPLPRPVTRSPGHRVTRRARRPGSPRYRTCTLLSLPGPRLREGAPPVPVPLR